MTTKSMHAKQEDYWLICRRSLRKYQWQEDPMSARAVQAAPMAFNKALIDRQLERVIVADIHVFSAIGDSAATSDARHHAHSVGFGWADPMFDNPRTSDASYDRTRFFARS